MRQDCKTQAKKDKREKKVKNEKKTKTTKKAKADEKPSEKQQKAAEALSDEESDVPDLKTQLKEAKKEAGKVRGNPHTSCCMWKYGTLKPYHSVLQAIAQACKRIALAHDLIEKSATWWGP